MSVWYILESQTFCEGRCRQFVAPEDKVSCVGVYSGSVLGCSTSIPGLMSDPCNKLLEPAAISDGLVISRVKQEMI